jgi:hypothetical protein
MNGFFAFCKMALALAVLILFGVTDLLPAARAETFRASGTFTISSKHGNTIQGAFRGKSTPGGSFTGNFSLRDTVSQITGDVTFVYSDGSTLSFCYTVQLNHARDRYEGTFQLMGGTGPFAGATGSGSIGYDRGDSEPFTMSGSLSK